jgi:hypothetical protein
MRDNDPLAVAFSLMSGSGRDPLGREIVSPVEDRSDWVQVRDRNGSLSYLPRTHLRDRGHPVMAGITYILSLAYIIPFVRVWLA